MDTMAMDLLKVFEYITKRRRDYEDAIASFGPSHTPERSLYEGRIEAYDDVLSKVEQVLGSHAVSSEKFAEQIKHRLRTY